MTQKPLTEILKTAAITSAAFFPLCAVSDYLLNGTYGSETHTTQETLIYSGVITAGFAVGNILYDVGKNMYHKRKQNQ